jgi:Uma2 family endonuclease
MIELMNPSRPHESQKSMIGRLVEAWCFEVGIEISPYGSWTLESKDSERGAEPDECYVIGDDPDPELPDLAIEVVWTSGGVSKLEVYRKLGVREVWIYERGAFTLHALRGEQYQEIPTSEVLSGIDLELLGRYVDEKPMTRAVRAYREELRSRA